MIAPPEYRDADPMVARYAVSARSYRIAERLAKLEDTLRELE